MIETDRADEVKYRDKMELDLDDLSQRLYQLTKDMKNSNQIAKLGEKQVDNITEKMGANKDEITKFKNTMKQKFYDIERRFNETKVGVDNDIYRIKTKVDEQLLEQKKSFEHVVVNCKDLVVENVKGDIAAGEHMIVILRAEFMNLIEQVNTELERK